MVSTFSRRRTSAVMLVLMLLLAGLLPVNQAVAQDPNPTVQLTPNSGPPGTLVTVTGSGWRAGATINISWENTLLTQTTADANGNIHASFTVPEDATASVYRVEFQDAELGTGGIEANRAFTVTSSPPAAPPDEQVVPLHQAALCIRNVGSGYVDAGPAGAVLGLQTEECASTLSHFPPARWPSGNRLAP
jgi:hypothetical protein